MSSGPWIFRSALALSDESIDKIAQLVLERLDVSPGSTWMSLQSTAAYLDWPPKRLYNLVSKNEIPHRKHANRLLFNRHELDRWLDLRYQGPSEFMP